jgi:hypothetical protein
MTPHDSTSSDISEENDDSGGHSAWVRSVLPTLGTGERPLEALQRPGEVLYVPEGWQVTPALLQHFLIRLTDDCLPT